MATYYSPFFSSGLLASHYTPDTYSPSTPRVCSTPLDDQDTEITPTAQPVASSSTTTLPSITTTMASPTTSGSDRPRLRRRRSSVTTSTSPVSALKSSSIPARTATASLQRLSLYTSSPTGIRTRSRSGSITDSFVGRTSMSSNEATQGNSLVGRMRSGSVGNSLRPRRTATRRVTSTTPAPPPPTAPLPALPIPIICPPSSVSMCSPSTPRRPLARRSQPSENLMIPINTPPAPRSLSPFIADDYPMPSSPLAGAAGIPSGLALHTSVAAFDYPSPIDTPGERFVGSYFPPFDMEMKEN